MIKHGGDSIHVFTLLVLLLVAKNTKDTIISVTVFSAACCPVRETFKIFDTEDLLTSMCFYTFMNVDQSSIDLFPIAVSQCLSKGVLNLSSESGMRLQLLIFSHLNHFQSYITYTASEIIIIITLCQIICFL